MLTINGGTFSGGLNTIKNDDYGELAINDGTFTSMSQAAFLNWNVATVNGGTFDAAGASNGVILNGYIDGTMDQGKLTINGGTFNAGEKTVITTMGGGTHSGDIEITGGTLNGSIVLTDSSEGARLTITQKAKVTGNVTNSGKADVAITDGATVDGQVSNSAGGTMSVVNSTIGSVPEGTTAETIVIVNSTVDGTLTTNTAENAAVMVGGKTYETLGAAITAAKAGDTIYVLKDIPEAAGIAVPSGKNFTIDFGGHTYTLKDPGAGSAGTESNGFQFLKDSTITLKNGTVRIAEGTTSIKRIIQNYANLTLEDMHFFAEHQADGEDYALSFNNGSIIFKGDTDIVTTSDEAIAFDVCKYSSYPSTNVTFDESYTGTINGKIVYDSTDADTHKLTIQGNGTFGAIEAASGAAEAAKSGIVGGYGDGAFPRGPAQTDIAVSKGRGKAFFHNGCRELFHAGGATGFKGIHGADMVVRRLIMTGKTAGTAGCQQDEAQKGGESMAAGHGISSLGYRDAAGKEGRESVRSSHACRDTGRWREDLVVGSGTFPSGRWDGEYETYFVAMFYFRNRNF